MVKIGICCSNQSELNSLRVSFSKNLNYQLTFAVTNGLELLMNRDKLKCDILLVQLFTPVVSGLEACLELISNNPDFKITGFSSLFDPFIRDLLQEKGIHGYCQNTSEQLFNAMDAIQKGGKYFTAKWQFEIPTLFETEEPFNSIELKIINYLANGYAYDQIGEFLHLSKRSIETYTLRCIQKHDLNNKTHLVAFASVRGLISHFDKLK